MRRVLLLSLCLIVLTIQTVLAATDENTARVVARACALNNPFTLVEMEALVSKNRDLFAANSPVIRCMRSLGIKLTPSAIKSYDPKALERAYDIANRSGASPELAQGVADKIHSGSGEILTISKELVWLAEVLPAAAQGNWGPFMTTAPPTGRLTHQQSSFFMRLSRRDADMIRDIFKRLMPMAENEIFLLALMYGD